MGLTSRLNRRAGGTEPVLSSAPHSNPNPNPNPNLLSIKPHTKSSKVLIPSTVRIDRDPRSGAILRVLPPSSPHLSPSGFSSPPAERISNPLNDPLNALDNFAIEAESKIGESRGVVAQLEAETKRLGAGVKRPKGQSQFEAEWVQRLVERWGDDVGKMARDRKMNPWQQSEGDLRRRIRRWRERGGTVEGGKEGVLSTSRDDI